MRILFLSRWFPYPPDNGSKIRVYNLLKHLAARHVVHLISFTSEPINDERWAAMRSFCQEVGTVLYQPFQPWSGRALAGFLDARPRSVVDTHSVEMSALVARTARDYSFDAVIASQIDMAPYTLLLPHSARVLEELELTTLYEQFARARSPQRWLRSGLTWWKLARYVRHMLRAFDLCTVVSQAEQEWVRRLAPPQARIEVVPNGVDLAHYGGYFGPPQPDTLIYSGALTFAANFDAVEFFLRDVFPKVKAARPGVKFSITGRLDGVPVHRLPRHQGTVFTGYLDDIRPAIARSWASVVPLRIGGGTRLKILEALALGTPVVATRKGAEGLELVPGRDALFADGPSEFAGATASLLADPDLRARLGRHGRRLVETHYDWHAIGRQFNEMLEGLMKPVAAQPDLLPRRRLAA
jgi:sugar transferase (PEP-CTERM/EpsH1 system associated)